MSEFATIDRCAAYVAARDSVAAVQRAAHDWPLDVATAARQHAIDVVIAIVDGLGHPHGTPARRRCLRVALIHAIDVSSTIDVARALGNADAQVDRALAAAGRTIALLSLFVHANSHRVDDDD